MLKPVAWTIAGSDPSGGAGIQADLHTFQQLGVHGATVITAITAQNSSCVTNIHYLSPELIQQQLFTLKSELPPVGIKIGMLGHSSTIKCIADFLNNYTGYVILDPVFIASSGQGLFSGDIDNYLHQFSKLFPSIDLLTPNIHEAEILTGQSIHSHQDMQMAAKKLLTMGIKNILIKGGHLNHNLCQDYWSNGVESLWLSSPRYPSKNYRGSGCVFSSAVTASLTLGYELKDALVIAKMTINQGIRLANSTHDEITFINFGSWPEDELDLPFLADQHLQRLPSPFPDCGEEPLGLYPIVDNSQWLPLLFSAGITTVQLRIKNTSIHELENEIVKSIQLAKQYNARLFINDYWQLAIKYRGYGVHLGQDDLKTADIEKIHQAGLRLGISTHCYYEVARAHRYKPSYVACGPIFKTFSKVMSFPPQGHALLKRWKNTLKSYPLVAIGGINAENISQVWATGISGIAVISAITQAPDPILATKKLLASMQNI